MKNKDCVERKAFHCMRKKNYRVGAKNDAFEHTYIPSTKK